MLLRSAAAAARFVGVSLPPDPHGGPKPAPVRTATRRRPPEPGTSAGSCDGGDPEVDLYSGGSARRDASECCCVRVLLTLLIYLLTYLFTYIFTYLFTKLFTHFITYSLFTNLLTY